MLVLDKPTGMSSNAALQHTKRLYSAAKAGHTGSLDPLATGVLPLCFGEATKFSQFLLDADKGYFSTFILGVGTSTADADGETISRVLRRSRHLRCSDTGDGNADRGIRAGSTHVLGTEG